MRAAAWEIRRTLHLLALLVPMAWPGLQGQMGRGQLDDAPVWREAVGLRARMHLSGQRTPADVLRSAELELTLGYPERARSLLGDPQIAVSLPEARVLPLMAAATFELAEFDAAAEAFARAAAASSGAEAGVLAARAGDAYERAGRARVAAGYYQIAASSLPELEGWLAVREARNTEDPLRALRLLAAAPPAARQATLRLRGSILLSMGDSSGAVAALAAGGELSQAVRLARAMNDSVTARSIAYRMAASSDTASAREGLEIARRHLRPVSQREFIALSAASRLLKKPRDGLAYAERAVVADTSDADALLLLADLSAAAGASPRALALYSKAAALEGEAAEQAAYRRGSLQLQMGQSSAGIAELLGFAERHPSSGRAPMALYLVADQYARLGRRASSDSLLAAISDRWPRHGYASRARSRLIDRALARRDTAAAVGWLRSEVDVGGADQNEAHFKLAALQTDSLEARHLYAELARRDSLGYYGTIARARAGLPDMRIEPARPVPAAPAVHVALRTLDLLHQVGFDEEAARHLEHVLAQDPRPAAELLDLAEGLIERGFMAEAIGLGWRATRTYTLDEPRVLRVIFPWPLRNLIEGEAARHGLDPYLLAGLIRQESAFRDKVVSRAGAHGLMQLMPATARQVARKLDVEWDAGLLSIADANLVLGTAHLASLLEQYGGAVIPALAAYNAGGTPVRRWLRYPEASDPVLFVERIPYAETRGYVRTVLRNQALYRALYPAAAATPAASK